MLLITYRQRVARTAFGALAPHAASDGPAPITMPPVTTGPRLPPATVYAPNGGRFPIGLRGNGTC